MAVLQNLEPARVFYFFEQISSIPRGSGNEKAVSDYICEFAKACGLFYVQDEANNVLIKKGGSAGYENAPSVILQGHLDMVCEKNKDTKHDFLTESLKLSVDGDYIRAEGTTLGADNGIAVAMTLALLDEEAVSHPPIEAVFTTSEEVGMDGARAFDVGLLSGKLFFNLDTEEEGHLVASCCGGLRATLHLPVVREAWNKEGYQAMLLKISGLKGGHSGSDIHLQRPNANKLLGRILLELCRVYDITIANIEGGLMDNAIAREAEAVLMVKECERAAVQDTLRALEETFLHEYAGADEGIRISLSPMAEAVEQVFSKETARKAVSVLILIPNGVVTKSVLMEGLVESSTNIGVLKTTEDEILFTSAVRSSVGSRKTEIVEKIRMIGDLVGATLSERGGYPAWEYKPGSKLLSLCKETYKEMFGVAAQVDAIHAGLECGLFSGKLPDAELISFGPEMHDAHTPDERLSISSTGRIYEYLKAILKKIK